MPSTTSRAAIVAAANSDSDSDSDSTKRSSASLGSGISLGHPIGATGAQVVTSAIYELRRRGGGIGVLSMCAGGGMGTAMIIEVA